MIRWEKIGGSPDHPHHDDGKVWASDGTTRVMTAARVTLSIDELTQICLISRNATDFIQRIHRRQGITNGSV
jgi:hypothetical protein